MRRHLNNSTIKPGLTIMLLIDVLNKIGGTERSLYLLSHGLRARGHRIIVCCLKGRYLARKMRVEGFYVEELQLNDSKIFSFKGLKTLHKLLRIAKEENITNMISYHQGSDYIGSLVAFIAKVPIMSSRRDMGFQLTDKHIWLYCLINHLCQHIIAVSHAVKNNIVKTQWTRPSKIAVIPNGVELFSRNDRPLRSTHDAGSICFDEGCLNVCYIANFRSVKGHEHLIDAISIVIKKFPNVRLYLVGRWDLVDSNVEYIKKKVRAFDLEKVVIFTGEVPPDDIPKILVSMDISVSSSMSEGMSNVILESMSAGKPVVATAVGGNPELVENGRTGYLVPPADPQSMAQALFNLLSDPMLRHTMGESGRSRVEREFSIDKMIEKHEVLLRYTYFKRNFPQFFSSKNTD